jgi:hypothetical protein
MARLLRPLGSLLLACAIGLACAAPAGADHGPVVLDESLAAYLAVAERHWGAAPACVDADGRPLPVHATLFDDPDPAVAARAEQPGCRIWLDRDYWPAPPSPLACVEIAHEWGHMLGHGHTEHGLMSEHALGVVPGCAVFRAERRALARGRAARRGRARHGCGRARRTGCRLAMRIG